MPMFTQTEDKSIERAIEEAAARVLFYWNPNGYFGYGGVPLEIICDTGPHVTAYTFEDGTKAELHRFTEIDGKLVRKSNYRVRETERLLIDTCENDTDHVVSARQIKMRRGGAYIDYTERFRLGMNPGDKIMEGGLFEDDGYVGTAEGGTSHWDIALHYEGHPLEVLEMLADYGGAGQRRTEADIAEWAAKAKQPVPTLADGGHRHKALHA